MGSVFVADVIELKKWLIESVLSSDPSNSVKTQVWPACLCLWPVLG